MITVVSLMWGNAWERYGQQFAETFHRHWPASIRLLVVADRDLQLPRGDTLPLGNVAGLAAFRTRWAETPKANGRLAGTDIQSKVDVDGYSWRHDAVKWAPQGMAPEFALPHLADGDVLVWLDADVVTFKDVPPTFIADLLGDGDLIYLGREPKHSEIGFWAMRVTPVTRALVAGMAALYRADRVFDLPQWHSAYVFDHCRKQYAFRQRSLTPGGRGHVWFQCELGRYTDHLKGQRKTLGKSKERR